MPLQEFGIPLPPSLPGDLPAWAPDPWSGDLYPHYQSPLACHASIQHLPRQAYHDLTPADCHQWNGSGQPNMSHAISLTNMEDSTQLFVKDMPHGYPLSVDYGKVPVEYPMSTVLPPQANGFQFISEVTNTLLGQ